MEAERQKFETHVHKASDGKIVETGERKGPVEKFEFGGPDDDISATVGGGYIPLWSPDFLQKELGRQDAIVDRFYFDKRVAVDIGDPSSKIIKRKRQLFFANGLGYLCIPVDFPKDFDRLRILYQTCLAEYKAYEELHPRPLQTQEMVIVDESGKVRSARVRAIDIQVGGEIVGGAEMQAQDLRNSTPMTKEEISLAEHRSKVVRAIRRAREKGQPFRNPFVKPGKRLYNVEYSQ